MNNDNTIEQLNIDINAKINKNNAQKVDNLAQSLERLQGVINKDFKGLFNIANQLNSLFNIEKLSGVSKGINKLSNSLTSLKSISFSGFSNKINSIVNGLAPLNNINFENLKSLNGINNFANGLLKLEKIDTKKLAVDMTELVKSITPLTNEFLRGEKGATAYANALNNINSVNGEVSNSNKKTKSTFGQIRNFISKITAIAFSIKRISSFISSAVSESSSFIENLNLFAVTFGESNYREMLDWATDLASQFGFANNEIIKMTGLYKQLATSLNITGQAGTNLSKVVTQLTLDFSSYFNKSIEQMQNALTSGLFAGQTKTMRQQLGIDISYQSLDNLIKLTPSLAKFSKTTRMMSQDQKVLLRLYQTMVVGENAFGDMGATINTLANNFRVLSGSIANFKLAISDAVLSAPIQKLAYWSIVAVNVLTNLIRILFPMKKELERPIAEETFISEINEDAEELTKTMGNLSFDYFNALGGESSAVAQDVALTEELNRLLEEQYKKYEDIRNQVMQTNEAIETANKITEKISKWLFDFDNGKNFLGLSENANNLLNLLKGVGSAIAGIKVAMLTGSPMIGVIVGLISYAFTTSEEFRQSIVEIFKTLMPAVQSLLKIIPRIADLVGKIIKILMPAIIALVDAIEIIFNILNPILQIIELIIYKFENPLKTAIYTVVLTAGALLAVFEFILKVVESVVEVLDKIIRFDFSNLSKNLKNIWTDWKFTDIMKTVANDKDSPYYNNSNALRMGVSGGIINTQGGTAMSVIGSKEASYFNQSSPIDVASQQNFGQSFEQAIYKTLPNILQDYSKQQKITIEDKSSFADFVRFVTPLIIQEGKRINKI